jgi:hypothetical protein
MRASTLGNNVLAINREIDSRYDAVIAVKNKLPEIELVSGMDITALIQELEDAKDFSGITVIVGDVASWDPVTKVLTVPVEKGDKGDVGPQGPIGNTGPIGPRGPRGLTGPAGNNGANGKNGKNGINGLNGMAPIYRFSIDNDANLVYEVIGYEEGPTAGERFPVQEW